MGWIGGVTGGSSAAAVAAAQQQAQDRKEENEMTRYTVSELEERWEFKIVRNEWGSLGKPEVLQRLMEEEAQAGWELVEVFDGRRVRFKRPHAARANDQLMPPDYDPYRTKYGGGAELMIFMLVIALLVALGLGILVVVIIV